MEVADQLYEDGSHAEAVPGTEQLGYVHSLLIKVTESTSWPKNRRCHSCNWGEVKRVSYSARSWTAAARQPQRRAS